MKRLILTSLRPMPCASYQWTSAVRVVPSLSLSLAIPLRLRDLPSPPSVAGGDAAEAGQGVAESPEGTVRRNRSLTGAESPGEHWSALAR
jgi:hypothetical protein